MRLLVFIFACFVKSNCCSVGISEPRNISHGGATGTPAPRNSGAQTNISTVYLTPTRTETSNVSLPVKDARHNVKVHNCCAEGAVDHESTLHNTAPNGVHSPSSTPSRPLLRTPFLKIPPPVPSKLKLTAKNQTNHSPDSTDPAYSNTTYFLSPRVSNPKIVYDAKSKSKMPSEGFQLESARFISEENLNRIPDYQTRQNFKKVESVSSTLLETAERSFTDTSVENGSFANNDDKIGIQQNVESLDKKPVVDTQMSSSSTRAHETGEEETGMSWLDLITSPFVKKALKYFATDFYPKKILDAVAKRWKPPNSTKNDSRGQEINLAPSVVYPLVMEGISILVNRLTDDDGSNPDGQEESGPVVKGQIVHGVIESLNKILKPSGVDNQNTLEKPIPSMETTKHFESSDLGKEILNSATFNQLLPLVKNVPLGDLQNAMNGLLGIISNVTNLHQISNASGIAGILSQPKVLTAILQNGHKFGGLSGFQNSTALAEILKKPGVLSYIVRNRSTLPNMGNLTSIMNQFLPKNDAAVGRSPKNPLLRSDFASKILAKSPIAHLGALDENIKRLITNSLEKAVSRVKINEKGEIQINEGMKKIVGKVMESDESPGENRTSDSLMGVLKSAIASGSVTVEHSKALEDDKPTVRRNVTHHSPLHRRFQEKYGKYYQKSSVEPLKKPHIVLTVLSVIITAFFK